MIMSLGIRSYKSVVQLAIAWHGGGYSGLQDDLYLGGVALVLGRLNFFYLFYFLTQVQLHPQKPFLPCKPNGVFDIFLNISPCCKKNTSKEETQN